MKKPRNFALRVYESQARVDKVRRRRRKRSLGYRCGRATISGRRAISFDPGNLADKLLRNYSGGSTTLLGPWPVRRFVALSPIHLRFPVYIPEGGIGSSHQAVSCGRTLLEK